jgi:hypothetical protein
VFIPISDNLCKVNHRLYRQSRVYECKVSIDANVADATTVDVYALADTWYLKGALKLAKSAWDEAMSEEMMANNGNKARWSDFRIEDGIAGAGSGTVEQFDQVTLNPTSFTAGEFYTSVVEDQAGVTRTFTLGTAGASNYNIIDEYDAQPGTSSDPTVPSTGPYSGLLPNLSTVNAASLSDDGNLPPYNNTGYGNAIWVKVGTIHLASGRQKLSTGFFKAPLGFVVLRGVGWLDAPDIQVEVKSGDYKGVSAHNMLE